MLHRKVNTFIRHFYSTSRNALLLTGARQVGKTYSIREFGKTFKSFVEINFIENPEAVNLLKGANSSQDLLLRLSTLTSQPLIKGETLIFFDEVQRCPDIVTAIKFLVFVPLHPQRLTAGRGTQRPALRTRWIYGYQGYVPH